ncbi:hypothetical protein GOBAR_AA37823 [Gossypium barbadense]|uniref:Uncharacterized protein n=1 Tax=Gossypium barbadense TaxID=3634 RepID=A0A2P5VVL9_GOSBA|nr:hypothetical protein GOBAR_AA37823 [Gossypium barbadense]
MPIEATCRDVSRRGQQSADMSQGICIPLILAALVKINKSKSKSKPLDSSASFFQDNSVSLGKLIGFRQHERGSKHFRKAINGGESIRMPIEATCRDVSRRGQQSADMSQGICIPLILAALVKINKSKSKSKPLDV